MIVVHSITEAIHYCLMKILLGYNQNKTAINIKTMLLFLVNDKYAGDPRFSTKGDSGECDKS